MFPSWWKRKTKWGFLIKWPVKSIFAKRESLVNVFDLKRAKILFDFFYGINYNLHTEIATIHIFRHFKKVFQP